MDTNELATVQTRQLTWDEGKYEFQRKLGNFVQYFQVNLPTNSHGVPLQLINPVVIGEHLLDAQTTDDVPDEAVEQAIMRIDFDDGIPIIEGLPIWERFEGETVEYYSLFKHYREMLYNSGGRALTKLSAARNVVGRSLGTLAKIYHWQLRCRAYDAYKRTEKLRAREFAIDKLESRHTKAAETLLEQAMQYLEEHPEQLDPKTALQMVQVAMKAARLSVGLNPDKPGSESGPSTNINIQQSAGGSGMETSIEGGTTASQDASYFQSIVHILDQSGALDKAKEDVILDAEYSEVDIEEPTAFEGT